MHDVDMGKSDRLLAIKRFQDEQWLREAFDKQQFVLYYQPQINLLTGKIHAVEALVRWQHPVRGLIGPHEFIGLAENLGLIVTTLAP